MSEKNIFRTCISALLAVLCVTSTVFMGMDIFSNIVILSRGVNVLLLFSIAGIALVFELWKPEGMIKRVLCLLPAALFGVYAIRYHEELAGGAARVLNKYLVYFNKYYKTAYALPNAGNNEQMRMAFGFFFALVFVLFYMLAVCFERYELLLAPPALMLSLELLVGYCPQWAGISLFACGVVLSRSRSWQIKKQMRAFAYLAVVMLAVLGLSFTFFQKPAKMIGGKQQEMLALQKRLEEWVLELRYLIRVEEGDVIDNHKPEYANNAVLELWMENPIGASSSDAASNLLLKGFYGAEYKNNRWVDDQKQFQKACRENGMEQAAAELAIHEYQMMVQGSSEKIKSVSCKLTDHGTGSKSLCLPYYTDPEELHNFRFKGDYFYEKQGVSNSWEFTAAYQPGWFGTDTKGQFPILLKQMPKELKWYDDYVHENYLTGSDRVPMAKKSADYIRATVKDYYLAYYHKFVPIEELNANARALVYAQKVAKFLEQHCYYSLELDPLPKGEDPVNYFLGTSQTGYCMHFASAGTLILRELGVPARYASGYAVGALMQTPEDAQLAAGKTDVTVSVLDCNAHAWVEIYLDGIGWYPVDMTPGRMQPEGWSGSGNPSRPEIEVPTEETEQETQEKPSQKPEETESESSESESASAGESDHVSETYPGPGGSSESESGGGSEAESESDSDSETGDDPWAGIGFGGGGSGAQQTGGLKAVLGNALLLLFLWLLSGVILFRIYQFHLEQCQKKAGRVDADLKRERYNNAVFRMNRQLYTQILKKDGQFGAWPSDPQYRELLIRTYPQTDAEDWRRFIRVAEKCAFSGDGVTAEEAAYCRGIFGQCADPVPVMKLRIFYLILFVFFAIGSIFLIFS